MNKQNNIDDLFRQAREQGNQASFNETKNLFLKSLESQKVNLTESKKGKVFTFKNNIIMSTIILFIALIIGLLNFQKDQVTLSERKENKIENSKQNHSNTKKSTVKIDKPSSQKQKRLHDNQITSIFSNPILERYDELLSTEKSILKEYSQDYFFGEKVNDEYIFPKLTEKEIEKTKKQKKKMLKALAKMDNRFYSYIPSGSFEYQGQIISVQAFYMQNTEVSNLEYRTFLFDLLTNNRKEEFLKAKPDQHKWVEILDESHYPMETTYFSNEGFNDYPVVNISREGAEMYCKWLTNELRNYIGEKNANRIMDLRLPTRQEWVKAASVEGFHKDYAFDGELYQSKLSFYKANFNLNGYTGPVKKGFEDSVSKTLFPSSNTYGEKKGLYTWKYNVIHNGYGLYNMCGNVAEMVVNVTNNIPNNKGKINDGITQKPNLSPGTAGGGWMNSAEGIKINAPDNHPNVIEAHPNIGFRVVTTHLGKGVRKMIEGVEYDLR